MMTATLMGGTSLDVLRHLVVDSLFLFFLSLLKDGPIFFDKFTVFDSLLKFPFLALPGRLIFANNELRLRFG